MSISNNFTPNASRSPQKQRACDSLTEQCSVIKAAESTNSDLELKSRRVRSSDEACVLSCTDKEAIMKGHELNDLHIDMAQNAIQIIHVQGNHWITISTINCEEGEVGVYDSLYNSIDKNTHDLMNHLVPGLHITLKECQK